MVICLSPVGAGALTNLFSALARDYAPDDAAAEHLVVVVAGLLGGIVNIGGALLGGVLADRMNRRLAYALCGALSGVCAVAMLLAPASPGGVHRRAASRTSSPTGSATRSSTRSSSSSSARARARRR